MYCINNKYEHLFIFYFYYYFLGRRGPIWRREEKNNMKLFNIVWCRPTFLLYFSSSLSASHISSISSQLLVFGIYSPHCVHSLGFFFYFQNWKKIFSRSLLLSSKILIHFFVLHELESIDHHDDSDDNDDDGVEFIGIVI